MEYISPYDLGALVFFVSAWAFYNWLIYMSPWKKKSLTQMMDSYRHEWLRAMLSRQMRIADTNIASGLQQGTSFFASTSLLAIGGAFAILNSTEKVLELASKMPIQLNQNPVHWETKAIGLLLILAYSFFKFGWAYRLFNYATIVMGSVPDTSGPEDAVAVERADRAARLVTLAGRHFSRGQASLFFSVGYLGWYGGPTVFVLATLFIAIVLIRRQFFSKARDAFL
ncbi:DUF599 domain-containing protein [Pseudovibrio exalbescens]|uniref:DUF599 domain-containing protein n=1 Tax=Pseudovibrio exalbescens TaxID=197461 RepID=A0A1U7JDK0_9HYPH|nr:DUF599 family protein [Pseudovibrio exalbescens]OKL42819.1 hypothetical protein A3843_16755 [Pseudovibrio exalbescens]